MEKKMSEESKELVKHTSVYQHKKDNFENELKCIKDFEKNKNDLNHNFASKKEEIDSQKVFFLFCFDFVLILF